MMNLELRANSSIYQSQGNNSIKDFGEKQDKNSKPFPMGNFYDLTSFE